MSRIEEIRERIEGCIRARYNQSEGDPEIVEECERARDDLRALEEVAEAARDYVGVFRSRQGGALKLEDAAAMTEGFDRLSDALDQLEDTDAGR